MHNKPSHPRILLYNIPIPTMLVPNCYLSSLKSSQPSFLVLGFSVKLLPPWHRRPTAPLVELAHNTSSSGPFLQLVQKVEQATCSYWWLWALREEAEYIQLIPNWLCETIVLPHPLHKAPSSRPLKKQLVTFSQTLLSPGTASSPPICLIS